MSQIDQQGPRIAKQGHRYLCNGKPVLALETGRLVRCFTLIQPSLGLADQGVLLHPHPRHSFTQPAHKKKKKTPCTFNAWSLMLAVLYITT